MYRIILGKCPWVLTVQTSKIVGGRLHRGGARLVQLSLHKRQPRIRSYLQGCGVLNRHASLLCLCFVEASLMIERGVAIMTESGLSHRLVAKLQQYSSLVVCKFRTACEEHCKWGHGQVCMNLWCWLSWHLKHIRKIAALVHYKKKDPLFNHKSLPWLQTGWGDSGCEKFILALEGNCNSNLNTHTLQLTTLWTCQESLQLHFKSMMLLWWFWLWWQMFGGYYTVDQLPLNASLVVHKST